MKSYIFWDITPCSPWKVNRRFGAEPSAFQLLSRWFLGRLFFNPEDGGDMFLKTLADLQGTTRGYIPENRTIQYKELSLISLIELEFIFIWTLIADIILSTKKLVFQSSETNPSIRLSANEVISGQISIR
jgi:hypothetical protein